MVADLGYILDAVDSYQLKAEAARAAFLQYKN